MNCTEEELLASFKMLDVCIFWPNKLHKAVNITNFGWQCIGKEAHETKTPFDVGNTWVIQKKLKNRLNCNKR